MTAREITKPQIVTIHALAKRAGLDDDAYRGLLERETGRRSCKELTDWQADSFIGVLLRLPRAAPDRGPGQASKPVRKGLDGPYAKKLQALWVSAWHLGLTRSRTDRALTAFVRRQTGLDHTRWLRDPALAARAIEGLKAWLAREGGVRWGDHPENPQLCVVEAQLRALGLPAGARRNVPLTATMQSLGEAIRASKEEKAHARTETA